MKVLLFIKKHWFKILSAILISIITIYTLFFGLKRAKNYEFINEPYSKQTIYTIWHIETFEGGGKARIDYLKSIARAMEKENKQILFMIKSIDPNKLDAELEINTPDIISFGFGVGKTVLPYLHPQENTFDIRDELISSGSFNKKFYAVPFIVGGYAMFNHSTNFKEFAVGTSEFTNPKRIYSNLNLTPKEYESSYEAYKDFVYDKNIQLLGTSRDLFRVNNLNSIGRTNAIISPIDTYTDLIQYLGICKISDVSNKFVSLALNATYQNTLKDYSLFSSLYNKLYSSGIYNDMEDAIYSCEIPNVFNE